MLVPECVISDFNDLVLYYYFNCVWSILSIIFHQYFHQYDIETVGTLLISSTLSMEPFHFMVITIDLLVPESKRRQALLAFCQQFL